MLAVTVPSLFGKSCSGVVKRKKFCPKKVFFIFRTPEGSKSLSSHCRLKQTRHKLVFVDMLNYLSTRLSFVFVLRLQYTKRHLRSASPGHHVSLRLAPAGFFWEIWCVEREWMSLAIGDSTCWRGWRRMAVLWILWHSLTLLKERTMAWYRGQERMFYSMNSNIYEYTSSWSSNAPFGILFLPYNSFSTFNNIFKKPKRIE